MPELQLLNLIVNGGAFALLTYLVVFTAPKLFREFRDEREAVLVRADAAVARTDAALEAMIDECREERREMLATFTAQLDIERRRCDDRMDRTKH